MSWRSLDILMNVAQTVLLFWGVLKFVGLLNQRKREIEAVVDERHDNRELIEIMRSRCAVLDSQLQRRDDEILRARQIHKAELERLGVEHRAELQALARAQDKQEVT